MSDTDADLTALIADVRAKAEAVGRESWHNEAATIHGSGGELLAVMQGHYDTGYDRAEHIARMDPATTIRLLDAAEADTARLTRERDDARAENERLRREYTPCDLDLLSRAEAAEAEVADLRTRLADADATIQRMRDAHRPDGGSGGPGAMCVSCTPDFGTEAEDPVPWPCETIRALDGPQDGGEG